MAKQNFSDVQKQAKSLLRDIRSGKWAKVYLLMGEEGYYIDQISDALVECVLPEAERAFNQTILYGKDSEAGAVVNLCRRYPMMSAHQLVVVREAQSLRNIDLLASYAKNPLDSTVLVLCYKGKTLDKRGVLYKRLAAVGEVFESNSPRDYEIEGWIRELFAAKGCQIEPKAVQMVAGHLGAELQKIENEADKLLTRLPEGTVLITPDHIEQNIGISKDFNVFELTRALSERDIAQALRIADYFGANAKEHPLVVTLPMIFSHFQRIVTLGLHRWERKRKGSAALSEQEVAMLLKLPSPFFAREYLTASNNYPNPKAFAVLGLLREFDMKSKGMNAGSAGDGELLRELILRIATL